MSAQFQNQNTATSSVQRRDSVESWIGSQIIRRSSPNNVDDPLQNDNGKSKLSGKAWGRVKKFLLCKTGLPSSIYYIVGNEFCERFSYYWMRAILILYLTRVLSLGDNTATAVFHSFSMLCYFTPLFGAMLADGWLGKYRWVKTIHISFTLIASLCPPAFCRTLKLSVRDGCQHKEIVRGHQFYLLDPKKIMESRAHLVQPQKYVKWNNRPKPGKNGSCEVKGIWCQVSIDILDGLLSTL